MTPTDMAALHALCFTSPPPWSADAFAGLMQSPGAFALTAPDALLIGRAAAGEAELLTLAVAPAARRCGTGRRLLRGFHARAAGLGAAAVFLEVAAGNAPARALYTAEGYRVAGRRPGYLRSASGAAEDALILRKSLVPA